MSRDKASDWPPSTLSLVRPAMVSKERLTARPGHYRAEIEALFVFQPPGLMADSINRQTSPTYHGGRDKIRTSSGDSCRDRAGPGDRERIRNQLILGTETILSSLEIKTQSAQDIIESLV